MGNTFDVIVVGAGYIGCSVAYRLCAAGLKTALFDLGSMAAGASRATDSGDRQIESENVFSLSGLLFARYLSLATALWPAAPGAVRPATLPGEREICEWRRTRLLAHGGIWTDVERGRRNRDVRSAAGGGHLCRRDTHHGAERDELRLSGSYGKLRACFQYHGIHGRSDSPG